MIDAVELTKAFGDKLAVDNLSFSVRPGIVTGFLGPNGAGKSTTMRLILGLDHPTSGRASVNGRAYVSSRAPMSEVGALLEAKSVHPGRTARNHLRALAATHGISSRRVDEVIDLVGLTDAAKKRAGQFSLGMGQRLGLAAALLADPETLMLDEPVNGLDPEGVAWVRSLVRHLAGQGRTVFISSHLMSEMAQTADHVIIIGRGRLIADAPMSGLLERASGVMTKVRSPQIAPIVEAAQAAGCEVDPGDDGAVVIKGWSARFIGEEAADQGWVLYELTPLQRSLEEVYMELTEAAVEFQAHGHEGGDGQTGAAQATRLGGSAATSTEAVAPGSPVSASLSADAAIETMASPPPLSGPIHASTMPNPPQRSSGPSARPSPAPATATLSTLAGGRGGAPGGDGRPQSTFEQARTQSHRPGPPPVGPVATGGSEPDVPQAKPRRAWVEE